MPNPGDKVTLVQSVYDFIIHNLMKMIKSHNSNLFEWSVTNFTLKHILKLLVFLIVSVVLVHLSIGSLFNCRIWSAAAQIKTH